MNFHSPFQAGADTASELETARIAYRDARIAHEIALNADRLEKYGPRSRHDGHPSGRSMESAGQDAFR